MDCKHWHYNVGEGEWCDIHDVCNYSICKDRTDIEKDNMKMNQSYFDKGSFDKILDDNKDVLERLKHADDKIYKAPQENKIIKIYILIDEYLDMERHYDYIDCTIDPEDALRIMMENQSAGHLIKVIIKGISIPK